MVKKVDCNPNEIFYREDYIKKCKKSATVEFEISDYYDVTYTKDSIHVRRRPLGEDEVNCNVTFPD